MSDRSDLIVDSIRTASSYAVFGKGSGDEMDNEMQACGKSGALSTDSNLAASDLKEYALVFSLVGKLLYANPEHEWIGELAREGLLDENLLSREDAEVSSGQNVLQSWLVALKGDGACDAIDAVKSDYMSLFVNQNAGAIAPPWESVYVNHSPAFFQCSTMGVRRWYQRYLLEAENREHEPDDHIGLELIFLGHLCAIAAGLVDPPMVDGEQLGLDIVRFDIEAFAQAHVFNWATHWCDIVRKGAKTDFYRGTAQFAKGAINCLASDLGKRIEPRVFR